MYVERIEPGPAKHEFRGKAWLVISAVFFFFAINIDSAANAHQRPTPSIVGWLVFFGLVCAVPVWRGVWHLWMLLWRHCEAQWAIINRRIPEPQEIAYEIERQFGRPARAEEVAAISQMLHQRRNGAMLNMGALVGGAIIAGKLADR